MTDTGQPAVQRMHPPDALWKYVVNPVMRTVLSTPAPTHGELADAARREGLSILEVHIGVTPPRR